MIVLVWDVPGRLVCVVSPVNSVARVVLHVSPVVVAVPTLIAMDVPLQVCRDRHVVSSYRQPSPAVKKFLWQ
jgi:hypothetical protein